VANFCETEQIVNYLSYSISFVQVRGSVPVFWEQQGLTTQTRISRGYDLTNAPFLRHFEGLRAGFGHVLCCNLMKRKKFTEQVITEAYEAHVIGNALPYVRYHWCDMQQLCKNAEFRNINAVVRGLQKVVRSFRYFVLDLRTQKVLQLQQGVVRTNCLDCLDRSNMFQAKLAMLSLAQQFIQINVNLKEMLGRDPLEGLDGDISFAHPLVVNLKRV